MAHAKLFYNGRSQSVRLPKQFRFDGTEVSIRREGDAIILEPIKPGAWPEGFFEAICIADDSFVRPPQGELPDPPRW